MSLLGLLLNHRASLLAKFLVLCILHEAVVLFPVLPGIRTSRG